MTTVDALRLTARLMACYPNWNPPKATQDLYLDHLEPLPLDRATAGIDDLVKRSTFAPAIGELLLACGVDSHDGREALTRAMAGKRQLLRDFRAPSGWVVDGEEPNPLPLPTRTQALRIGQALVQALPAGAVRERLAGPSTALVPVRSVVPLDDATVRQRTEQLQARAQDAIDGYERATRRLDRQRIDLEALQRALQEDVALNPDVPAASALDAAARAVKAQTGEHDALAVVVQALWPGRELERASTATEDGELTAVTLRLRPAAWLAPTKAKRGGKAS